MKNIMNRSRVRRLEKMAKPDAGRRFLVVVKDYSRARFYLPNDPSHIYPLYPSADDAMKAWESQHGELPRSLTLVVIVDFKSAAKLEPV